MFKTFKLSQHIIFKYQNAFIFIKEYADYVTKSNGGERAVAEACLHILNKFFFIKYGDILEIGM
jgi:3-deoxy-D-manno-octulosonate 8-phosphate phosphatase KdsC-like HAD superfamily phosphatase